jgi:signal transduction histidine kinase
MSYGQSVVAGPEVRDRVGLARLAEEQAALRRLATLVARGAPPAETFDAVIREIGRLLPADSATLGRYENDGTVATISFWSSSGEALVPIGIRLPIESGSLTQLVRDSRNPARLDYAGREGALAELARNAGWRSAVGAPVIVEGRLWGLVGVASTTDHALPSDTEERLAAFTELLASAIATAQGREDLTRLAEEQAALRRVATLVAEDVPASDLFGAVVEEATRVLRTEAIGMLRFEPDRTATLVAQSHTPWDPPPLGTRFPLDGENVVAAVLRTGEAARLDNWANATGPVAAMARSLGIRSAVATPILVDGRLWGTMIAVTSQSEPLPPDTESRIAEFTELVATAISNAQARSELAASRARIAAASDDERRRVVRDLHDGAQQRLVHTVITLKLARRALEQGDDAAPLLAEALDQAERATDELRELTHGIMPSVLARGGLRAGVQALASRTPVPVQIEVSVGRLPAVVETTAYFVVAEALTNVAKHSGAGRAEVTARVEDGTLRVRVRDDGVGGARPDGSGLVGLVDRLAAIDGRLSVESPVGGGTVVAAAVPLPG